MPPEVQDVNTTERQELHRNTRPYDRDELLNLQHQAVIRRHTRKQLFKFNLWNPGARNNKLINTSNVFSDSQDIRVCLLNPCSACNKALVIRDFIIDHTLDVLALTEVWGLTDSVIADLLPAGYEIVYNLRNDGRRGGGVAVISRTELKVKTVSSYSQKSFDAILVKLSTASKVINISVVYAPASKVTATAHNQFLEEFSPVLLTDLCVLNNLLILGDFNYHVNNDKDIYACKFLELLDSCGLKQNVNFPTHRRNNTLDLVISREDEPLPCNISSDASVSPDHFAVLFSLPLSAPRPHSERIISRKWRNLDLSKFKEDLQSSDIQAVLEVTDVSEAVTTYNNVLSSLVDKHAPIYERTVQVNKTAPWYNERIRQAKRNRRKAERKWRKTHKECDRVEFRSQCNIVDRELKQAKSQYYHTQLSGTTNQKDVYKITNGLLFGKQEKKLPTHDTVDELADRFADYFVNKIVTIRNGLCRDLPDRISDSSKSIKSFLSEFDPATETEIKKLINKSASKSCDLDPIPTWLLKQCTTELLPVITHIVNLSLSTSNVPSDLKKAYVTPLIKKALLDPEVLKNYRPVSNLAYISKLIERVVANRLNEHLLKNGLHECLQSAYKRMHSTETALLRVQNDLLMGVDADGGAILVLLDLSAAFDTIDHDILCKRLQNLGVVGAALAWFRSYLNGRRQYININGKRSQPRDLPFGVPQGSVLGPILFTLYTSPLGDIARKYGLRFHLYADDTQLYITFRPADPASLKCSLTTIRQCIDEIRTWMWENLLKLNGDKTEILIITTGKYKQHSFVDSVSIDGANIIPAEKVRNLGAVFDRTLNPEAFINSKCKSLWYLLRNISRVRRSLTIDSTKTIVQAYITSRLDYCNCLLYGAPAVHLNRLQKVQNYAARLVMLVPKRNHITPVLAKLHWLPVNRRVDFKTLMYTYKSLNGLAPEYLAELLHLYTPGRPLRSANHHLLDVPNFRLDTFGRRAFMVAAPVLWNSLPTTIKTSDSLDIFKKRLKTHLYQQTFL